MTAYRYRALNPQGKLVKGVEEGDCLEPRALLEDPPGIEVGAETGEVLASGHPDATVEQVVRKAEPSTHEDHKPAWQQGNDRREDPVEDVLDALAHGRTAYGWGHARIE